VQISATGDASFFRAVVFRGFTIQEAFTFIEVDENTSSPELIKGASIVTYILCVQTAQSSDFLPRPIDQHRGHAVHDHETKAHNV
jgi:hypothetical protein